MGREAEGRERGEVVRSGVALIARPGVGGMAGGQELHQAITHRFRDHRRRGDRVAVRVAVDDRFVGDRKSTRLNSSHGYISYAVFCLKKKKNKYIDTMRM